MGDRRITPLLVGRSRLMVLEETEAIFGAVMAVMAVDQIPIWLQPSPVRSAEMEIMDAMEADVQIHGAQMLEDHINRGVTRPKSLWEVGQMADPVHHKRRQLMEVGKTRTKTSCPSVKQGL